jgi:hypothetical protein
MCCPTAGHALERAVSLSQALAAKAMLGRRCGLTLHLGANFDSAAN